MGKLVVSAGELGCGRHSWHKGWGGKGKLGGKCNGKGMCTGRNVDAEGLGANADGKGWCKGAHWWKGKNKSEGEGKELDGPADEADAAKHDLPEGGKCKGKGQGKPTWGKAKGKGKGMCKLAPWVCDQCGGDLDQVAAAAADADGVDGQTSAGIDEDESEGEGNVFDGPADEAEAAKHDLPEGGRCKGKGKAMGKPTWGKAKGKSKGKRMCKWAPWVCSQCGGDLGRVTAAAADANVADSHASAGIDKDDAASSADAAEAVMLALPPEPSNDAANM
eukprot:NODE_922_length_1309_cov_371.980064.p3 GENE.NODE_922_length_1309_cov_371.980064~~NODE_922_length_1309_cov_371.980064.p3  ORF type:complete len:276 (-),score=108.54 NODE_922_length_1309_cov_371.980064:464-1291(-)